MRNRIKLVVASVFIFFVFVFGASADVLGQSQRFFISSQYDAQSRTMVDATLKYISERAYFYVADEYWDSVRVAVRGQIIDQIGLLAQEFDSRIYPIETQFFGSEPNPGINGNSRMTILLTPLIQNAGGYFDTANQYPLAEVNNSNQREMIYLNINVIADLNKMFAFLAHEFQHIITFNQKENIRRVSDDVWLNELRSEYAITLLGYNNVFDGSHLEKRVNALEDNPTDSLTEWKNLPADYGQISLLGEYIAEHYSPQVIADTLKNNLKSIPSLNNALSRNGFSDSFIDIYRNWLIANFLNGLSSNSSFGYTNKGLNDFRVNPTRAIKNLGDDTPITIADTIKDWQGRWYDISQLIPSRKNGLKITFDSPSLASFYISYIVFNADNEYEVYSFNPIPNANTLYIPGIGIDASSVVIMPIKKDKLSGFSANESAVQLITKFERIASLPENAIVPPRMLTPAIITEPVMNQLPVTGYQLPSFSDGSLIRAENDYKIYVINGKWRRHIISPEIFKFYPHLGFDKVKVVPPSVLSNYQESNLVRYVAEQKVYAVNEKGVRQWLNITPRQFTASGRAWDSIFEVNLEELTFYKIGASIMR